jgi:alpha/beta superfamily hydrolase
MSPETPVTFPSGSFPLEGRLSVSDPKAPGVVICHPHPAYGGSMDNNVVYAVRDTASRLGLTSLIFNFRGVGRSGGSSTGELMDARDVGAAVDFLAANPDLKPAAVYLVGYSYGAWVGIFHAVSDSRIAAWVAVSPPAGMFDFSYLIGSPVPKLIVCGDADDFIVTSELDQVYARLDEPKRLVTIHGADHFYWGREEALAAEVEKFLKGVLEQGPKEDARK